MSRGFLLLTIGLAIVTSGASAAEIVTVCTAPEQATARISALTPFMPPPTVLGESAARTMPRASHKLALSRDEKGYDIVVHWQDADEQSLRADGAQIQGMELGADFVHVLVSRDSESLEHFVFNLNSKGSGELLWSGEAAATQESLSSVSACAKSAS